MSLLDHPLLAQFIPEARELLEQSGRSLLALERQPEDAAAMAALFRAVHTLKGTSGLFEIPPVTQSLHAAEDLLGAAQAGRLTLTPELADVLLDTLDQLGRWIEALARDGTLGEEAEALAASLVQRLARPLDRGGAQASAGPALDAPPAWLARVGALPEGPLLALTYTPDAHCFFRGEDPLGLIRQLPGLAWIGVEPLEPWPGLEALDPFASNLRYLALARCAPPEAAELFRYVPDQLRMAAVGGVRRAEDDEVLRAVLAAQLRLLDAAPEADPIAPGRLAAARGAALRALTAAGRPAALPETGPELRAALAALLAPSATPAIAPSPAETPRPAAPSVLRVEQAKVDALMNLIGEFVVAKNALAWLARRAGEEELPPRQLAREIKDRHALFNRIAEDMQAAIMSVRMLPVDHVFQRFPRLVRDIARRLGKQVELRLEGAETEADKNVVEALADPLIHMVRNSLDHGIEPPAERLAAGKPEQGTLRLSAQHENDHVVIRVSDDGRGLDAARLRAKAVEKGLIEPERAAAMSEEEAFQLIFLPGFSTAAAVSDLSGRGVGMDVVRTTIEKAGGRVRLSSRPGEGTVVEIALPLSMAITRIMTVACGERLFGVPMALVVETVRVPRAALHRLGENDAFVLRDRVVPVLRLSRLLDLPEPEGEPPAQEAILVVRIHGERLGIIVSAFEEVMETIVKPLEGVLAGLRGFTGTTLLGDGRVLLILDVPELVA
jgi:two-component system, chemotaxis family, sensor kinase CheA